LPDNVRDLTRASMATSSTYSRYKRKFTASQPTNWCPHPILYLIPLFSTFTSIFLIPFAANTPSFMTIAIVSRAATFSPLLLPYIVPQSWGTVHTHPHDSHSAYTGLFRTISIISFLLHGKSTVLALLLNTPDSYYHRHSLLHPFRQEHRSILERSSTAVGKVLGAIGDHPAVSAVGWDVLLSGLSVGLWAAIRGLDVQEILRSTGLWYSKPKVVGDAASAVKKEAKLIRQETLDTITAAPTPAKRRPGRPKKSETAESNDESVTSAPKRRGRARKSDTSADGAYKPAEVVRDEGDEEGDADWEVGALAWGLISALGLGTGSAGVFGAETTAR